MKSSPSGAAQEPPAKTRVTSAVENPTGGLPGYIEIHACATMICVAPLGLGMTLALAHPSGCAAGGRFAFRVS